MFTRTHAQTVCESILDEDRRYNAEHNILKSQVALVEQLFARGSELVDAYDEIHAKLGTYPRALRVFFMVLLDTAMEWNPQKNLQARAGRETLIKVNKQIADTAETLAMLLRRRDALHNTSGFGSETHYHVAEVLALAGEGSGRFSGCLADPLEKLRATFDLKYWPTLEAMMDVVAADAAAAKVVATDPFTAAATAAPRHSKADYFKAFFVAVEQNSGTDRGQALPDGFKLTDATLATLANCALNLPIDEIVDAAYVKRLRQRLRDVQQAD